MIRVKYIAEKILKINERKRWTNPPPTDPALRAQQDEEIFQTARLVKSVLASVLLFNFANIFLSVVATSSTPSLETTPLDSWAPLRGATGT
jgi:hypothetical protein